MKECVNLSQSEHTDLYLLLFVACDDFQCTANRQGHSLQFPGCGVKMHYRAIGPR